MRGKPQRSKWQGKNAYYASYAGVEWYLIVTDEPETFRLTPLLPFVPKTSGAMALGQTPTEQSSTVKIFAQQYERPSDGS